MLKYVDTKEVFSEVPDEISLAINFSNCPIHCKDCHSQYLWEDKGYFMTTLKLKILIKSHIGITCVCFMGGDSQPEEVEKLAWVVKHDFPKLKVCWYSGRDKIPEEFDDRCFDYLKLGHYDESRGPLTSKTTNQVFLKNSHKGYWEDITNKFWK